MDTILLTGGGTAGHIYPLLAVKERLEGKYKFAYIGGQGMESQIIPKEKDIDFYQIPTVKLERKLTLKNFLIPIKLIKSINQSKKLLQQIKPNIIFSKGGFVAMPVVLAAAKLNIPVISHESDLSFGLANKIILKKCNVMCTAFKQTATNQPKCIYTGQPIRKKILQGDKRKIYAMTKFDKDKPNLLVVGGSLGASFLNEKVWKNIDKLTEIFNVVHIAGKQAKDNKHTAKNYIQIDYAENIGDYLAFADIVLSRAGAGAINELFTNVSNGKSLLASAITDKGIPTLATDSFETMAKNIFCILTSTNSLVYKKIEGVSEINAEKTIASPIKNLSIYNK